MSGGSGGCDSGLNRGAPCDPDCIEDPSDRRYVYSVVLRMPCSAAWLIDSASWLEGGLRSVRW